MIGLLCIDAKAVVDRPELGAMLHRARSDSWAAPGGPVSCSGTISTKGFRGDVHQRREVQLRGVELPLELLDVALGIEEIQAILQRHQAITEFLALYALGLLDGPFTHSSKEDEGGSDNATLSFYDRFSVIHQIAHLPLDRTLFRPQMQLCCHSQIIQLWFSPGLFGAYLVPLACHYYFSF